MLGCTNQFWKQIRRDEDKQRLTPTAGLQREFKQHLKKGFARVLAEGADSIQQASFTEPQIWLCYLEATLKTSTFVSRVLLSTLFYILFYCYFEWVSPTILKQAESGSPAGKEQFWNRNPLHSKTKNQKKELQEKPKALLAQ